MAGLLAGAVGTELAVVDVEAVVSAWRAQAEVTTRTAHKIASLGDM
jgi:hypothetical protein